MKAYLARMKADPGSSGEMVGFYVARSSHQLYDPIDECCDVDQVEVLELGPGGLYWSSTVDFLVSHPEEGIETAPGLSGGASACEYWWEALFEANAGKWEQVTVTFADND
jgi:hypothetical protein